MARLNGRHGYRNENESNLYTLSKHWLEEECGVDPKV
jgi:hypothetical protein